MSTASWMTCGSGFVSLNVKVQPRASRNEVGPVVGDQIKVKVTAPPVDSAANEAVMRLIAEALGCPRSAVELVRGQTSRTKVIRIFGISPEVIAVKLGV